MNRYFLIAISLHCFLYEQKLLLQAGKKWMKSSGNIWLMILYSFGIQLCSQILKCLISNHFMPGFIFLLETQWECPLLWTAVGLEPWLPEKSRIRVLISSLQHYFVSVQGLRKRERGRNQREVWGRSFCGDRKDSWDKRCLWKLWHPFT